MERDDFVIIFRPYVTTRDGRRIWARWVGKKAFPIRVRRADLPESPTDL